MAKRELRVSLIVLTFNRIDILEELLASLYIILNPEVEIIVVDNHSTDETQSVINERFPDIVYFRTAENIGVAARNIGLTKASGDIIITLDDDIIIDENFDIRALIDLFDSRDDIGAVCFKIFDEKSGEVCNWCHHYNKDGYCDQEFNTDEITEGAVAFRKEAIAAAGYYPTYFFISHEGHDLLCRMLDRGYKTIYSPRICVRHRTHPAGRTSWRRYYYDTRNQIWLAVRNFPLLYGLKYLFRGLSAMFFYSLRDGYIKYWFRGVKDGIAGLPRVWRDRKPVSGITIKSLNRIAANRPGLFYMMKQRVFKRGIKL